jgi:hypothetical protein
MQMNSISDWRRWVARIACVAALGALLAGCDKCGDWWWSRPGVEACKQQPLPNPQ